MNRLVQLSQRLDQIIQFHGRAILGHDRSHNPLYSEEAPAIVHHIGEGSRRSIRLDKVISAQATVDRRAVRSMKDRYRQGRESRKPATVVRVGNRYVVADGNHRLVAAYKAGRQHATVLVQ